MASPSGAHSREARPPLLLQMLLLTAAAGSAPTVARPSLPAASNVIISATSAAHIRADSSYTSIALPTALAVQLCTHGIHSSGNKFSSYTTTSPECVSLMNFTILLIEDVENNTVLTQGEVHPAAE